VSAPAGQLVRLLVADKGIGDPVAPVRHGTGDDPTRLAAGAKAGGVRLCGGVLVPQPNS
jgi:hypothetical protein